MSDLESTLRSMAKSGRLNHVSVAFSNGKWSGSYRGVEDRDGRHFEANDVVSALMGALTGRKVAEPAAPSREKAPAKVKPKEDEDLL